MERGCYQLRDEEAGRFTTLRELFEISENIFISIDLKDSTQDLCTKVDALIKEFNRENLTFWGSIFHEQHKLVQTLSP